MIELQGKYNKCKVFTNNIDNETISQLINLLNQKFVKDNQIRIMPDTHAGKGCVIGTTITITDKVVPNLVGVDIGCGMLAIKLKDKNIDLPNLDSVIRKYVTSGFNIHDLAIADSHAADIIAPVDVDKAYKFLGTLGGGNHFIEVDMDKDGNYWLVIHTGSRHLGIEVCDYYQNLAYENLKLKIPFELAYLEGQAMDNYLHDMKLTQEHARINRETIASQIIKHAKLTPIESFDTIHNYIDTDNMILRKGSISAQAGERVIIPLNMRDGSLICTGRGNPDWNYSAPHGAGRILSRSKAKDTVSMDAYRESMKGIYTTSVSTGTIDESPFAYKPAEEIIENIKDTVEVIDVIKPIYNFKASENI